MLGRTHGAECRALVRLLPSLQHHPRNTIRRFGRADLLDVEELFRVERSKLLPQFVSAARDRADATPFSVCCCEDLSEELLCRPVSVGPGSTRVLVFHNRPSFLKLP